MTYIERDKLVFTHARYKKRWLAYVDLLGFKDLVNSSDISDVVHTYFDVLSNIEQLCAKQRKGGNLLFAWFSDTFLIYTKSHSVNEFIELENAVAQLFVSLISKGVPARGCISFGKLYSQQKKNIFIGPVLIDAYIYGEKLNWIGLSLSPVAENELSSTGSIKIINENYKSITNESILRSNNFGTPKGFHFKGNAAKLDHRIILNSLVSMRDNAPDSVSDKYTNLIDFIHGA